MNGSVNTETWESVGTRRNNRVGEAAVLGFRRKQRLTIIKEMQISVLLL